MLVRSLARSGALYVAPLALALEIPTFLEGRELVGVNGPSTMEVANGSASLLLILAVVAGCSVSLGWNRHESMVEGLPGRAGLIWLAPGLMVWMVLTAVHLLWIGFVWTWASAVPGPDSLVGLLPTMPAFLAGSLLGALAARASGSWVMAPFLGLALYIALIQFSSGRFSNLVSLGGIGIPLRGISLRPEIAQAQVVWFSVLALGAAAVIVCLRRWWLLLAAVAGLSLVLVAIAAVQVVRLGPARFGLADPSFSCYRGSPRFCLLQDDDQRLVPLLPRLRLAGERWSRASDSSPATTYWQRLDIPVPGHVLEVSLRGSMSDLEMMEALISASYPCSDGWDYRQFLAMERVATRLVGSGLSGAQPPNLGGDSGLQSDLGRLTCPT